MTAVAFVCLHGAAKSVVAAAHYRALAAERGYKHQAASYGVEPDSDLPDHVLDGLRRDGLEVVRRPPIAPTREALADADVVVLIGCELPDGAFDAPIIRWDGVPDVTDGYDAARTEIVRRLHDLFYDAQPCSDRKLDPLSLRYSG